MKVDEKLHCKDCDGFGACEYYNRRKGTSQICSEFKNQWKIVEELEKIKAEMLGQKMFYTPDIDIIDNHIKELKGESNEH